MNYTLHKLPEGFIITSDEKIQENDLKYIPFDDVNKFHIQKGDYYDIDEFKVIAQQDQIDFSALSEEEQKEIGWFDVEKIADNIIPKLLRSNYVKTGFIGGFQKAQELLSDRKFTLDDIKRALEAGFDIHFQAHPLHTYEEREEFRQNNVSSYIRSLSQPKSWNIEGNLENNLFKITRVL